MLLQLRHFALRISASEFMARIIKDARPEKEGSLHQHNLPRAPEGPLSHSCRLWYSEPCTILFVAACENRGTGIVQHHLAWATGGSVGYLTGSACFRGRRAPELLVWGRKLCKGKSSRITDDRNPLGPPQRPPHYIIATFQHFHRVRAESLAESRCQPGAEEGPSLRYPSFVVHAGPLGALVGSSLLVGRHRILTGWQR